MDAHHHPQLIDFHNDGGLLALHADMPEGGVLAAGDVTAPWPVSLSLFDYSSTAGASLVGHHHQPVSAAAPSHAQLLLEAPASSSLLLQPPLQLVRRSKYLGPVKELLHEFCSLHLEGDSLLHAMANNKRALSKADDVAEALSSSGLWGSPSLMSSMDLLDLDRRKARLLSMVEEVDRRYRRYREQMRAVEASFEAVAGAGAAQVYTRLALRAMSRHFRCLRDALLAQVRAVRKAMGERDGGGAAAPAGATKGDTPRLRALDQCLRRQLAFQQPGAMENCPWRPQRGLPERAVAVLRAWLFEHFLHPYPNDVDKHILARQTGLSRSQVSNWFINARVRLWKPMIEEMYTEEVKQQSEASHENSSGTAVKAERSATTTTTVGGESYQLRTLVNNPDDSMISSSILTDDDHHLFQSYPNLHGSHSKVSLTLGLQQQQPFPPSMMMQHHRSTLISEGEHGQQTRVLSYRNLMASHESLHDFAG